MFVTFVYFVSESEWNNLAKQNPFTTSLYLQRWLGTEEWEPVCLHPYNPMPTETMGKQKSIKGQLKIPFVWFCAGPGGPNNPWVKLMQVVHKERGRAHASARHGDQGDKDS